MTSKPPSTASSGPLSSPSPSPSPPPDDRPFPRTLLPPQPKRHMPLDTSSELSELTDEEQDTEKGATSGTKSFSNTPYRRGDIEAWPPSDPDSPKPGVDSDSAPKPSSSKPMSRFKSPLSSRRDSRMTSTEPESPPKSSSSSSRRGKKRRSLVPEPMWDWAYKEKERAARKNGADKDKSSDSSTPVLDKPPGDLTGSPLDLVDEELTKDKEVSIELEEEEEEEEEEETPDPPKAMEEEEDEDEDPGHTGKRVPKPLPPVLINNIKPDVADMDVDPQEDEATLSAEERDVDDDVESEADQEDADVTMSIAAASPPPAPAVLPRPSLGMSDDEDGPAEDDENETASEAEDPEPDPVIAAAEALMDMPREIEPKADATAPSPAIVKPVAAAAAASSIMAGSSVMEPEEAASPTSSASSSRSTSPILAPKPSLLNSKPKLNGEGAHVSPIDTVEPAADEEGDDEKDMDVDDADMEIENDSDLQPAHRAEALDELAKIELKFALLRERSYVEKMGQLAWEEGLVNEGMHPEMLHLHAELSKRRDKRIELAEKRRSYEIVSIGKRRRAGETITWTTWLHARDDLQTEMIAETNRKRRKLERERRAADRPQPVRRIPSYQPEIPVPPTLRDLVHRNPFLRAPSGHSSRKPRATLVSHAHPQLPALDQNEITSDLDYLLAHRRSYEPPRQYDVPYSGMGMGMEPAYPRGQQLPGFGMAGVSGGSRSRHEMAITPLEQELMAGPAMGIPGMGYQTMSREISPVHIGPSPGAKINGWPAGGQQGREWNGGSGRREEEPYREREAHERERERGISLGRPSERDGHFELERTRDRRRDRHDREFDRERELQLGYPQAPGPSTSIRLVHAGPVQAAPHAHHHHVHHHHHHHHNGANGPAPLSTSHMGHASQPHTNGTLPMSPLNPNPHSHAPSPRRDAESGRPASRSGPSTTEVITLSPATSRHVPNSHPSPHWRADERDRERELPPSTSPRSTRDRERGRPVNGQPPLAPHERIMTPFGVHSQAPSGSAFPPGLSSAAAAQQSRGPSRRGSFSADGPTPHIMGGRSSGQTTNGVGPPPSMLHSPSRQPMTMSPPRTTTRLPPPSPSGSLPPLNSLRSPRSAYPVSGDLVKIPPISPSGPGRKEMLTLGDRDGPSSRLPSPPFTGRLPPPPSSLGSQDMGAPPPPSMMGMGVSVGPGDVS
ncbi:Sds3-like-domain-containing protein [Amylostereum chailletii]|nr:Sds3-like-domain-containing protein [Amylostereum chailletii]